MKRREKLRLTIVQKLLLTALMGQLGIKIVLGTTHARPKIKGIKNMSKMQKKAKDNPVKQFMFDYFKNIDFDYWEKRLNFSLDKILKLKRKKSKSYYLIDAYSIYLQLLEIFFVNTLILCAKEDGFLPILFTNNSNLREMIKQQFTDPKFINWFMDNLVFGFKDKTKINNYEKKRKEHQQILKESVEDYLKDFEFLNSYKHGFRVQIRFDPVIGIENMALLKADTKLIYFTREHFNKGKDIVYKNLVIFNHERISTKSYFILQMLKNCQKVFLAQGKAVNLEHYFLTDLDKWQKTFGAVGLKEPLFYIEKMVKR